MEIINKYDVALPDLDLGKMVLCGSKIEYLDVSKARYGVRFQFSWDDDQPLFRIYGLIQDPETWIERRDHSKEYEKLIEFKYPKEELRWIRRAIESVNIKWNDVIFNEKYEAYDLNQTFNRELNKHYQYYLKEITHLYDDPLDKPKKTSYKI